MVTVELLDTREVARILGLAPKTVANLRKRGGGPEWVAVGGRSVRYTREALTRYLEARRRDVPRAA